MLTDASVSPPFFRYILDAGMKCVYCIGEPLPIREKGIDAVLAEMAIQLTPIKDLLDPSKVVIAYEPVWVSVVPRLPPMSHEPLNIAQPSHPHLSHQHSCSIMPSGHWHWCDGHAGTGSGDACRHPQVDR